MNKKLLLLLAILAIIAGAIALTQLLSSSDEPLKLDPEQENASLQVHVS